MPTNVIRAFILASADPMPKDLQTLRDLIDALLIRIDQKNTREGKNLRAWIQYLTAIVHMHFGELKAFSQYDTLDAFNLLRDVVLGEINGSGAKRRTQDHFDTALGIQHHLLQTFLHENPYQGNRVEWEIYWRQHQNKIVSMLTLLPCFCAYETMRPAASWKVGPDHCSSEGEFIEIVLASLHGASPRTIRGTLPPPPQTGNPPS